MHPTVAAGRVFIYVPLLHTKGSLTAESDSRDENALNRPAHEDWLKIPLAERVVVYAYVRGEEEQKAFYS